MLVVDLSENNDGIDFARLARVPGLKAVWLKTSEGLHFVDHDFAARRNAANRAGLRVGAYHFARPDLHPFAPLDEADHFASVIGKLGRTDLKPALDYEILSSHGGNETWAHGFSQQVRKRLGCYPVFYSYSALLHELAFRKPVGSGLWLASYGRNDGTEHPSAVPAPWRKLVAHQFSSRCSVTGCAHLVDVSSAARLTPLLAHPWLGRL